MLQVRKTLTVLFVLLSVSCNAATQAIPATQVPASTQTPLVAATSTATDTPTATLLPTDTPTQAPTNTPITGTAVPTIDPFSATEYAQLGSMGMLLNIRQYFNPAGTPLTSWHNVPIMPNSIAGQEFSANIYSYTAAATLDQARQFYLGKLASLGITNLPGTGSSGSGSNASHNVDFTSFNLTIVLTSFDNDTGPVIVVISKVN
jgi:hypothetical protein